MLETSCWPDCFRPNSCCCWLHICLSSATECVMQGPMAEVMMKAAMDRGHWVFFQNCHLAPSWMPGLDRLIEHINPVTVRKNAHLKKSMGIHKQTQKTDSVCWLELHAYLRIRWFQFPPLLLIGTWFWFAPHFSVRIKEKTNPINPNPPGTVFFCVWTQTDAVNVSCCLLCFLFSPIADMCSV